MRLVPAVTLALATLLAAPLVRAQAGATKGAAKPDAPKPKLVAPKQLHAPPVPYPAGATGSAVVVLEVVVDAAGAVEKVTVVEGEEPFASAAIDAAKEWKFEPATSDGAPVRATIKAKVTFEPPAPLPPEEPAKPTEKPPEPSKPAEKPKPKAAEAPIEVWVEGDRKEVAQTTVGGGEVRILPGAFGDPFRMIEALPGVVPIFSGLPFFYIRGAPPGNTGFFIDGIKIPMLFHLGAGPSVLAPGLIDRVDFHPAGYPSRFGRFAGGIVAGETIAPATRARGEWNVRLFDASAMVETPIGKSSDVLVSGRYGYPALILNLVQSEVSLQYWDYQVRAGHRLSDRDRISAFFFGAFDRLVDKRTNNVLFDTQFHRGDFRWDRLIPGGRLRVATTLMFDQTGLGDDNDRQDRFAVRMTGWGARAELEKRIDDEILFRAGTDLWIEQYKLVARERGGDGEDQARLFPSRADVMTGVRFDLVVRPSPRVEIVPGVRFDVYSQGSSLAPAVEPRLATRLRIAKKVWTISTLGVAHQQPSFVVPFPGLRISNLSTGLQESWQYGQGVEVDLPFKTNARVTGFVNSFNNLSDVIAVCGPGNDDGDCDLDTRVRGRAYGLEVLVKRDLTENIGGWLAYTLSRSQRTYAGRTRPSDFDRTHVLSAAFSWNMGAGWRFGSRFSYLSGRPYTIQVSRFSEPPPEQPTPGLLRPAGFVQRRLPDFWRLDVRLEKRWVYTQTSSLAFVIEWFNVSFNKEAIEYRCIGAGTDNCRVEEVGPVTIPSLGLEGTF